MSRPTHQHWPTDDMLVAYVDGTLDADAAATVARHLETDAEARAFVRALQDSADLARHAFDEALDDGNWLVEGAVRMAASPPAPDHDFTPAKGDHRRSRAY